jgi:hypothetical protein
MKSNAFGFDEKSGKDNERANDDDDGGDDVNSNGWGEVS